MAALGSGKGGGADGEGTRALKRMRAQEGKKGLKIWRVGKLVVRIEYDE